MMMTDEWERGFGAGYAHGLNEARRDIGSSFGETVPERLEKIRKTKRKRRQSPKQKLLTQLTNKKWKQYRKGSGKKTYIEIRAQVSRSQDYKRKAKRLK
jgi:hypothetical protein